MKTYSSIPGLEGRRAVPCALCGSRLARTFLKAADYSFVRCRGCGLVYQNPQPVFEDLRHRYAEDYFRYELENEANFFQLMLLGLADVGFERRAAAFAPGGRFLDVGCATGMLLEHMRGRGWEVRGVDLCRQSVEYARRRRELEVFAGTLFEAAFPPESFAVVHFSHLLEHIPEPREFLLEVRRILAPGGLAIITTPNVSGLQARLFGKRWRSAIADHLILFSKKTLGALLGQTGFRTLATQTWGGLALGTAPGWLKPPADRLAKRWGFGDVMLFLAAKG